MSLCLQVEQAAANWLRSGTNLVLWKTQHGTYEANIENNRDILLKFHRGFELNIQVLTDEGDVVNVKYPAIICTCNGMVEPEETFPTGNHVGELHVVLKYPADDWSGEPDVLAALEDTAHNLRRALYRSDLAERLSEQLDEFTCVAIAAPRSQTRDRDGRLRIYTMVQSIIAGSFDEEESTPS